MDESRTAGEITTEDVLASSRLCSEAERDFRVSEAELLARPFDQDTIAAQTAAVFGKLHAYLAAFRAITTPTRSTCSRPSGGHRTRRPLAS